MLPAQLRQELWYSNVLVGVIRGALEMINLKTKVTFLKDMLRGDPECEIRVELQEVLTKSLGKRPVSGGRLSRLLSLAEHLKTIVTKLTNHQAGN